MASKSQKYDAVVAAAYENGETIEAFGDFDGGSEEGNDVRLIKHGGLWLVLERIDNEEVIQDFLDEDEAREAFATIQEEIDDEDEGDTENPDE
jgi:hypothetical protein